MPDRSSTEQLRGRGLRGGLAAEYGTTPSEINADIRTLTLLGETSESDWLLSLNVEEGDRLALSGGPYRRPIRFTPDEVLAMQVGMLVERGTPTRAPTASRNCSSRSRRPLPLRLLTKMPALHNVLRDRATDP